MEGKWSFWFVYLFFLFECSEWLLWKRKLLPFVLQTEEHCISSEHIKQLIGCLGENIRSPDRKQLTNRLLKLRASLYNDAVPVCSLQVALFSFQDAVCDSICSDHWSGDSIHCFCSWIKCKCCIAKYAILLNRWSLQVKKVLRQQQVKPHWMFALDNLLRQAVQDAITVLLPGIFHHPGGKEHKSRLCFP